MTHLAIHPTVSIRKGLTLLTLMLLIPGLLSALNPRDIKRQFKEHPGKSGGVYYAYPFTSDSVPEFPAGYEPVYISHYGRHGSRWAIHESQYPYMLKILEAEQEKGNLTPEGEEILSKVRQISDHAEGHAGELSPLGQRQHKGIAERMLRRTPSLFTDSTQISAISSIVPRCIISMSAFTERLKEINPQLRIIKSASPGDMDFISYSSDDYRRVTDDSLGWKVNFKKYREKIIPQERLMKLIFKETPELKNPVNFLKTLHDIAITTQNVELDVDLLSIFTIDELFAFWQAINYNMYVRHANSPEGQKAGMYSARSLLDDFITRADAALDAEGDSPKVQLRFGHDTNLIRLLALMQLEGLSEVESDPNQYYAAWQDFKASPMGANLQLIFLRPNAAKSTKTAVNVLGKNTNKESLQNDEETLVLILHNERPVRVPIATVSGSNDSPFYRWSDLKRLWQAR